MIKENNLLFLLGAGCSKEAGIPLSNEMVIQIEDYIKIKEDWMEYEELYNYLRSSIQYSEGIFGNFNQQMNVEKLLYTINEIEKREKNIVYPFIGSWNIRLNDVAGPNFRKLTDFKFLINKKLNEWVKPKDYLKADYYEGFKQFQSEIGYAINVFTLNYDLCFERIISPDFIELGFNPKSYEWHYKNFDANEKQFNLYKLHGSINWYLENSENQKLKMSVDPVENPELIFGTDIKMKSIDPYLFYTYAFRKHSLDEDCRLIIAIGYSFSDEYINSIITQALRADSNRVLMAVAPTQNIENEKNNLMNKLSVKIKDQIIIQNYGAKEFLLNELKAEKISKIFKESEEVPFK